MISNNSKMWKARKFFENDCNRETDSEQMMIVIYGDDAGNGG